MSSPVVVAPAGDAAAPPQGRHPLARLIARRTLLGLLTLLLVSLLVFWATQVLPGDAAQAILGRNATPESLSALREQLHLDRSPAAQYMTWLHGLLTGDTGSSLTTSSSVWDLVAPRLKNSAILLALVVVIAIPLALLAGVTAGVRRDTPFDHATSTLALMAAAVPEFVVAIALILLFASLVFQLVPPVSLVPPGESPLSNPQILVLPVATLTIAVVPYILRMVRAAIIESMNSEYVEMARLKGLTRNRVVFAHALPNSLPPTIQAIGLTLAYLAGGVVVVEYVFGYPGIGQALVTAVNARDVPVIQFIVIVLAAFYIIVNVTTDVISLLLSPKARTR